MALENQSERGLKKEFSLLDNQERTLIEQKTEIYSQMHDSEDRYNKYDSEVQDFEESMEGTALSSENIDSRMLSLNEKMNGVIQEAREQIGAGNDDGARHLIGDHGILFLQSESYKSMKNVVQNDQKILIKNGKTYLLEAGQDEQSIEHSPEVRANASQKYEQSKHKVLSVKVLVDQHKVLETNDHSTRLSEVDGQLAKNNQQKMSVTNQLSALQASNALTPRPPGPGLATPASTTMGVKATLSFKAEYSAIKNKVEMGQNITLREFQNLVRSAPQGKLQRYLSTQQLRLESEYRNLPTSSIPSVKMQTLIKNMAALGLDPTPNSSSNLLTPEELKDLNAKNSDSKAHGNDIKDRLHGTKEQDKLPEAPKIPEPQNTVENEAEKNNNTAPTPFKTKPD